MKICALSELPVQFVSHNPEIQKRVMLGPKDLPHLTNFSQARLAPGQVASAHHHPDMYEVFFIQSGEGTICVDGVMYPLQAGVCVAVELEETHEITNTGNEDLVMAYFGIRLSEETRPV